MLLSGNVDAICSLAYIGSGEWSTVLPMFRVTCPPYQFIIKILDFCLDNWATIECPNAVWCSDITYIWTRDGFVYLTSIMDLYSRKIIAWTLSDSMDVSCVIETVNKAKIRRKIDQPLIIHSDRGSQYISREYKRVTAGMQRSYSKKAYPWDNLCIE